MLFRPDALLLAVLSLLPVFAEHVQLSQSENEETCKNVSSLQAFFHPSLMSGTAGAPNKIYKGW